MEHHDHAAHGIDVEPGSPAWSEWVKDYYRDVETYDWVDVADNLRGPEAFFHRNRARVVRQLTAKYAVPDRPILDAGCGTGLNLRHLPIGSTGIDINPRNLELIRQRLPGYGAVETSTHGPQGSPELGSVPPNVLMSFGPCPSARAAIGASTNAARMSTMMKTPPAIAILSRLKRSQTCSQ